MEGRGWRLWRALAAVVLDQTELAATSAVARLLVANCFSHMVQACVVSECLLAAVLNHAVLLCYVAVLCAVQVKALAKQASEAKARLEHATQAATDEK